MPRSVFIVDDHSQLTAVLKEYLALIPDIVVTGSARSGEAAIRTFETDRPDLVLIDVALPGMSGLDLVEHLHRLWPELRCLMLSGHAQPEHVQRALTAGARGFILKGNPYEIAPAIRDVLNDVMYLSPSLA